MTLNILIGNGSWYAAAASSPQNILPPTIETVISGATINQVGTMLRVKRGGWPATQGWTLDWGDPNAEFANPGIPITNGSISNPVKFALSRRYQWLRNGADIPGQNGVVYTVTNDDVGKTISVKETVTRIVTNQTNTDFVESNSSVSVTSVQTVSSITGAQVSNLVYQNNIVYLGTFKIRDPYFDGQASFGFGGNSLAIDPNGNGGLGSLFMNNINNVTGEFAISSTLANGFTTDYAGLPESAKLQVPRDVRDGWTDPLNAQDPGFKITGQLIYNGNLIQTAGNLYSTANPVLSHAKRSKDLSVIGGVVSSKVSPSGGYGNPRYLSGPMCLIPSSWQTALGGKALTGWAGESINSNANKGPPAYAFDPDLIGTGNLTAQTLLYYSNATPLDPESQVALTSVDAKGSQAPMWTSVSFGYGAYGMCIPNGTSSLLYFGTHPTGLQGYNDTAGYEVDAIDAYYGGGSRNAFDPNQSTRSPYAWPYVIQCWAYDLNSLAASKEGSVLPYNVKPYAIWSIPIPYACPSSTNSTSVGGTTPIKGAVYDAANKKIYIAHNRVGLIGSPVVISVYSVTNAI